MDFQTIKDSPERFLKNQFKKNKQSYFCNPFTFLRIVELEKKRLQREEHNLFLLSFKFTSKKEIINHFKFKNKIESIFNISLRKSDLLTWVNQKQINLLLVKVKKDDVRGIIKRVIYNFNNGSLSDQFEISVVINNLALNEVYR